VIPLPRHPDALIGRTRADGTRFWTGRDWICLVDYEQDCRRRLLTRHITTLRRSGRLYRRSEETHVQKLYKGRDLAKDLRDIGFRVRVVRNYGRFRLKEGHVVLIARKHGSPPRRGTP
jgi:hypothetical protein